jgi:RNA polymerase sigma factor (sigma-70 family)
MPTEEPQTSSTLFDRLRNGQAWPEFVDRYGPRIYQWCHNRGLQDADAQDVTQDILLKLVEKMRTFRYDRNGSFRGWLYTVTNNAVSDLQEHLKKPGRQASGSSDAQKLLENVEAREDLIKHLEEEFDRELLHWAMDQAKLRVKSATWQAFELMAVKGLSGKEAAEKLNIGVAAVYVYHGRVTALIQKTIAALERGKEKDEAS